MEFVILDRNTQERLLFYDPGSRLALGRDDGGCGVGPSAESRSTRLLFCRGLRGRFALRRRLTLRSASRDRSKLRSVCFTILCLQRTAPRWAAHGMTLQRCVMRKAHSGPTTKCFLRRRTEKPLPGAVKRTWGAFHPALLRFWSIFPGFAHAMYAKDRVAVWMRRNSVRLW